MNTTVYTTATHYVRQDSDEQYTVVEFYNKRLQWAHHECARRAKVSEAIDECQRLYRKSR